MSMEYEMPNAFSVTGQPVLQRMNVECLPEGIHG
jgi:hypothetical protein